MNASAPANQKVPVTTATQTSITVYNGAETRLPQTIQALETLFGVTSTTATDASGQVDILIVTGSGTAPLTPPPAP